MNKKNGRMLRSRQSGPSFTDNFDARIERRSFARVRGYAVSSDRRAWPAKLITEREEMLPR